MKYASSIAIWLILSALIGTFLYEMNTPTYLHIRDNQETVNATITGTVCGRHASVAYSFVYLGKSYAGKASGGARCPYLKVGDAYQVWFAKDNPDLNMGHEPKKAILNELITMGLGMTVFPTLIVWRVRRRKRQGSIGRSDGSSEKP